LNSYADISFGPNNSLMSWGKCGANPNPETVPFQGSYIIGQSILTLVGPSVDSIKTININNKTFTELG